jgi:hypothetical protein
MGVASTPAPIVVSPKTRLTKKQALKLESSLPEEVRNLLESANEFTIIGEITRTESGVTYPVKENFEPNTLAEITTPELRKEILEALYTEVSNGEEPATCWLPHHKLIARRGGDVVEIEICFSCASFEGTGSLGKFSGTFAHGDSPKAEGLINRLLVDQGRSIR